MAFFPCYSTTTILFRRLPHFSFYGKSSVGLARALAYLDFLNFCYSLGLAFLSGTPALLWSLFRSGNREQHWSTHRLHWLFEVASECCMPNLTDYITKSHEEWIATCLNVASYDSKNQLQQHNPLRILKIQQHFYLLI